MTRALAAMGLVAALVAGGGCTGAAVAGDAPATVTQGPPATPGDPVRGEQIYARCLGCHSLEYDRTGPRHCGIVGRRAGTVPGFAYSDALVASGITWSARSLEWFLADPLAAVPGTKMTFAGVPDAAERRDLVAWLVTASADPTRCGPTAP